MLTHRCVLLVLFLALPALACGCGARASSRVPAARVGTARVSATEVASYAGYALRYYAAAGKLSDGVASKCSKRGTGGVCGLIRRQALTRLIEEQAVLNYGARRHITLTRKEQAAARRSARTLQREAGRATSPALLRSIVERAWLVRKIEEAVTAPALRGLEYHVRIVAIPYGNDDRLAYGEAEQVATTGSGIPAGAETRTEWMATFRVPKAVRGSIADAMPGQYLGPYRGKTAAKVIEVLGREIRRYGQPARLARETAAFHVWLRGQLRKQGVQCFNAREHAVPCPMNVS